MISKQLRWSCTACGMSSGRKYSVQRHIINYNIHNGGGNVIPFIEYTIGRREGKYQPQQVRKNARTQPQFLDRAYVKISQEVEDLIVKDIAKRIFIDLSADQRNFNNLKTVASMYILKKNNFGFFTEPLS